VFSAGVVSILTEVFVSHMKNRLSFIISQAPYLKYIILFAFVFLYFLILQGYPSFADPDSFYHAKMAELISQNGIVFDFPYLQFTVLNNYFADHHFLYHILLIPFVTILNPLVGLKLATICFATLAILTFYWLLNRLKIKGAIIYTLILLTANPFIFRLNLAKAQGLALIALFVGLYLIIQRRYVLLSLLSFLFVWLYGGWPLILVITFIFVFCSYLSSVKSGFVKRTKPKSQILNPKQIPNSKSQILKFFVNRMNHKRLHLQNIKLLLSVVGGLSAGLIFNPYFPKNLLFYWQQIIQIAVVNYQKIIGVGGEWYPYNFFHLIAASSLTFIIFIIALTIFFLHIRKKSVISITTLILSLLFLGLTLKSRRNVEYFIPFAILFSAISINQFISSKVVKQITQDFKKLLLQKKYLLVGLIIPIVLLPYIVFRDVKRVYIDHHKNFSFTQYQDASNWLNQNTTPKSIVLHSDWDEFPILFYHNTNNYYIVGLDPTFMYNYNKDLYWKWYNITMGQEKEFLYQQIKNDFKSEYVFIEHTTHQLLDRNLSNNFYFEEVYRDQSTKIYKVN